MRDSMRGLCLVLMLSLLAPLAARGEGTPTSPAAAPASAPAGAAEGRAAKGLRGHWAIMASETELTEAQRQQLLQAIAARDAKVQAWEADHGQEVGELREQAKDGESEQAAAARRRIAELGRQKKAISDHFDQEVDGLMTPEQRQRWQSYRLYLGAMTRYKRLELSEDQVRQIRTQADTSAQAIAQARQAEGEGSAAEQAEAAHQAQFHRVVVESILTDAQRQRLEAGREKKPATTDAEPPTQPLAAG